MLQTPRTRLSPQTGTPQELRNGRWHNVEQSKNHTSTGDSSLSSIKGDFVSHDTSKQLQQFDDVLSSYDDAAYYDDEKAMKHNEEILVDLLDDVLDDDMEYLEDQELSRKVFESLNFSSQEIRDTFNNHGIFSENETVDYEMEYDPQQNNSYPMPVIELSLGKDSDSMEDAFDAVFNYSDQLQSLGYEGNITVRNTTGDSLNDYQEERLVPTGSGSWKRQSVDVPYSIDDESWNKGKIDTVVEMSDETYNSQSIRDLFVNNILNK